jgi:hypothetical protein
MAHAHTLDEARAAKPRAFDVFSQLAEVVGVGITRINDGYGVKVNIRSEAGVPLPGDVDGVPVRIEVVGTIRKQ